jgi:hypothetical protein
MLYQPKEDYMTDEEIQRGTIFDQALTKAYEYAESDKVIKLDRRACACDGYLQGFLDGVAYRMGGFNAD